MRRGTNASASVASNKQGILFSTIPYDSIIGPPILNNSNITFDSIVVDTINWIHVKGEFVADSNYKYIIIGNFYDDLLTDTIHFGNDSIFGTNRFSYYFLDDICVSKDSTLCFTEVGLNEIFRESNLLISPNPSFGIFNVSYPPNFNKPTLEIFDLLGKIRECEIEFEDNSARVKILNFESGVYFIIFKNEHTVLKEKFLLFHNY